MSNATIDPAMATAIGSILNRFREGIDKRIESVAASIPDDWRDEALSEVGKVSDLANSKQAETLDMIAQSREDQEAILEGIGEDISTLTGLIDLVEASSDKVREQLDSFTLSTSGSISALSEQISDLTKRLDEEIEGYRGEADRLGESLLEAVTAESKGWQEAVAERIEEKMEFARLNADLWKEQTQNKLAQIDAQHAAAAEALERLQRLGDEKDRELAHAQEEIAETLKQKLRALGPYRPDTTYKAGDCVMRDGATFWCVADETDQDPRTKTDTPAWRLLSMRGERGEKGDRGQRGLKGEAGRDGKDGVGIVSMVAKGLNLVLATSDGQAIHVDLAEGIEQIVDERMKAEVVK